MIRRIKMAIKVLFEKNVVVCISRRNKFGWPTVNYNWFGNWHEEDQNIIRRVVD